MSNALVAVVTMLTIAQSGCSVALTRRPTPTTRCADSVIPGLVDAAATIGAGYQFYKVRYELSLLYGLQFSDAFAGWALATTALATSAIYGLASARSCR